MKCHKKKLYRESELMMGRVLIPQNSNLHKCILFCFLACDLSECHSQAGLTATLGGRLLERAYKVTVNSTLKHRCAKVCQAQRLSELGVPPLSASPKCPFYPGASFLTSEPLNYVFNTRWATEQRKQQSQSWSKIQVHIKF